MFAPAWQQTREAYRPRELFRILDASQILFHNLRSYKPKQAYSDTPLGKNDLSWNHHFAGKARLSSLFPVLWLLNDLPSAAYRSVNFLVQSCLL